MGHQERAARTRQIGAPAAGNQNAPPAPWLLWLPRRRERSAWVEAPSLSLPLALPPRPHEKKEVEIVKILHPLLLPPGSLCYVGGLLTAPPATTMPHTWSSNSSAGWIALQQRT